MAYGNNGINDKSCENVAKRNQNGVISGMASMAKSLKIMAEKIIIIWRLSVLNENES